MNKKNKFKKIIKVSLFPNIDINMKIYSPKKIETDKEVANLVAQVNEYFNEVHSVEEDTGPQLELPDGHKVNASDYMESLILASKHMQFNNKPQAASIIAQEIIKLDSLLKESLDEEE